MEKTVTFDLEVTLKRFSAVAFAIEMWERPYLKNERTKFFEQYVDKYTFQELYVKWWKVTEIALKYMNDLNLNLPESSLVQLNWTMVYIGDKIFDWVSYIVKSQTFNLKCTETIYWTPHGTVNDAKVLRLFWQSDPTFPGWLHAPYLTVKKVVLNNMSCIYAETDIIEANKKDVINFMKKKIYGNKTEIKSSPTCLEIMGLTFCMLMGNLEKSPSELYKETFEGKGMSPAANLFFKAVSCAADRAIEYFYGKLTKKEREEYLPKAARQMLYQITATDQGESFHKKERLTSSTLFLINHMSNEQKKKYLTERGFKICEIFLIIPPYDQLCRPMMEYVWSDLKNDTKEKILKFTLDLLTNFQGNSQPCKKEVQREFFGFLLQMTEKISKKKIIVDGDLSKLFKLRDFPTLNIILHDPDLEDFKTEILPQSAKSCLNLAE